MLHLYLDQIRRRTGIIDVLTILSRRRSTCGFGSECCYSRESTELICSPWLNATNDSLGFRFRQGKSGGLTNYIRVDNHFYVRISSKFAITKTTKRIVDGGNPSDCNDIRAGA